MVRIYPALIGKPRMLLREELHTFDLVDIIRAARSSE
jgi:hypothetical protein